MDPSFSTQRWLGLITGLSGVAIGWYTLLLMTNPQGVYLPTNKQLVGLLFAVLIGILAWVKKCFVILPH